MSRTRYTLTVTIEGDEYAATDATDAVEDAIKALGEGSVIAGGADNYVFETQGIQPGAIIKVAVKETRL